MIRRSSAMLIQSGRMVANVAIGVCTGMARDCRLGELFAC